MAKIFLVEDESIISAVIRDKLERMGHTVCGTASTGEEAVKQVEETRPDLVIMDIMLKGDMDGIEAARRIHEHFDIPVIYLTAYDEKDTRERANATNPAAYIVKLLEDRDLRPAIERAVKQPTRSHDRASGTPKTANVTPSR
jgi:CheY-like chemotaxis protein